MNANTMPAAGIPDYWPQAALALARADAVMAGLIGRFPDAALASRGDPFMTLVRSIVGQQISVKAADSVWARLLALLPEMTPEAALAADNAALRGCGLSSRKADYIADLAAHFTSGRIRFDDWPTMNDAELVNELTAVRGIGEWTAQMFMIFNQLRPDILPLDDIGLQKAVAALYFAGERPTRRELAALAERWRPWRSVATWYLWRSLDPLPVSY